MSDQTAVRKLIAACRRVKQDRLDKEEVKTRYEMDQKTALALMEQVGVDNELGVVYNPEDKKQGAAYYSQNSGSEYWNMEEITKWLRRNPELYRQMTVTVVSVEKFEAAVAAGEVPIKIANRFKEVGSPSSPFVRFGPIRDNSITED